MTTKNYFDEYGRAPECSVSVDKEYVNAEYETEIVIYIAAEGGGTYGESYAWSQWIYEIHDAGELIISGEDLRSNAVPATHEEMTRSLTNFLANDGDRLYRDSMGEYVEDIDRLTVVYDPAACEFLIDNAERFARHGLETEDGE